MGAISTLAILCYIGDVAFIVGGIIAARRIGLKPVFQFLSGMSTAFFGGAFIRDLGLLHTAPSILGSPIELVITAVVGILTIIALNHTRGISSKARKLLSTALCAADSIGVAGFAAFGFAERGMKAGAPLWVCFVCGFVTACGGGIIAALIRSAAVRDWKHIIKTLADNKFYYSFGMFSSVAYGTLYTLGMNTDTALLALTAAAVVIGLVVEYNRKA